MFRFLQQNIKNRFRNRLSYKTLSSRYFTSDITDHNFANGTNAAYIDAMYHEWNNDPSSVHKSWDIYFRSGSYVSPPTLTSDLSSNKSTSNYQAPNISSSTINQGNNEGARLVQMIRSHQVRGHLLAKLDPLNLPLKEEQLNRRNALTKSLHLESYGFNENDLNKNVNIAGLDLDINNGGLLSNNQLNIGEVYDILQQTYLGSIGYEYMHIPDVDQCQWLRDRIEKVSKPIEKNSNKNI